MSHKISVVFCCILLVGSAACTPGNTTSSPAAAIPSPVQLSTPTATAEPAQVPSQTSTPAPIPTVRPAVPDFKHIIVIVFENHEFDSVIGNRSMPNYNQYANGNTLLTQYYAITHPSLPNYLALFGKPAGALGGPTFRTCPGPVTWGIH